MSTDYARVPALAVPQWADCPVCGVRRLLRLDGRVSRHRQHRVRATGPYVAEQDCRGGGQFPQQTQSKEPTVKARPVTYRGTLFASTLEADWAATFDSLNWYWEYEPVAVTVGAGITYRPDFWLPTLRTWCEVKGPHNERLEKTVLLEQAVRDEVVPEDEWELTKTLVVVLRPAGPGETMMWESVNPDSNIVIVHCPECTELGWMDMEGIWRCPRGCRNGGENKFWKLPGGGIYRPGELSFQRAPRGGVA